MIKHYFIVGLLCITANVVCIPFVSLLMPLAIVNKVLSLIDSIVIIYIHCKIIRLQAMLMLI